MTQETPLILLADDEPWFSEALAVSLESRGFECLTTENATSALIIMRRQQISVLVTDVMMPAGAEFDETNSAEAGFQLIDRVRSGWPNLPIICLSVIADQAKIRSLADRKVRYLRKGETPLATAVEVISAMATGRRIRLQ